MITNNKDKINDILTVLKQVKDPEIGLNVVDLGLIYQVDIDDDESELFVTMTLTTQFCPMGESIINAVKRVLEHELGYKKVHVSVTFDPPWNSGMITDEGERFLNNKDA